MRDNFQVRDLRGGNAFFIHNTLIKEWGVKIGPYGIAVYNVLAMHADNEHQTAYPSYQTIADLIAISRRQVMRSIEKLVELKIITKAEQFVTPNEPGKKLFKSNIFTLLHPTQWGDSEILLHESSDCESPLYNEVVTDSHQGSDCESLGVVTVSHPNKTQENNTHNNKTQDEPAPVKPDSKHPAIQAFRAEMHRYPRKNQYADIINVVGEKSGDVERWQQTVKAWKLTPWSPLNIGGMLEFFEKKELPSTNGSVRNETHQGHNSRFGTGHDPTLNKTTNPYTGETVYLS